MKNQRSLKLFALLLAGALALAPALHAQDVPPAAPPPPVASKLDQPKPAPVQEKADDAKVAPAGQAAAADTTVTADTKSVDQPKPVSPADEMKPAADEAAVAGAGTPDGTTVQPENSGTATSDSTGSASDESETKHHRSRSHRGHNPENERVSFFQDSTLAAGEKADAVVSIIGSSTSAGDVGEAVVSVFGSSTSSGNVGDAVVSVLGNTRVTGGTVGDAAVAVLGSTTVNGHVRGDVVAVLGNVELGPDAVVDGQIVCIGGGVTRNPTSVLHGNVQNIAIGGHHFNFDGLHTWFTRCVLYARPLAFDARLLWAWCVALAFLGFYALLALAAPVGVTQCVQTLEERPGKSLLAVLLVILLTPVVYLLLVLTLAIAIGFVLIPLLSFGLFIAGIFGRVVMLAWLGRRITNLFGDGPRTRPVFAVLIGGVIVLGLYTVPILGFITYKLLGLLGLGVVLYTLLLSFKESKRKAAAAKAAATAAAVRAPAAVAPADGAPATGAVEAAPGDAGAAAAPPPILSAATLPRAGFWIRIAAVLLDVVLFGIGFGMLGHMLRLIGGGFPLWFAAYNVIMWGAKGTTIGGIICGLKIVRLDDRPVDWGVAVVRALAAFLSLAVAGLGFIWVAFDNEKQSWHDKIVGTTIVQVPKGTTLL